MNVISFDICCSLKEYYNISSQIEIDEVIDIDEKYNYAVFTIDNCSNSQFDILESELDTPESIHTLVFNLSNSDKIIKFINDNNIEVEIDEADDIDELIILNSYIIENSHMTFDMIRQMCSL